MTKKVIILSALITLIMISACIAENPKGETEGGINWFTNLEEAQKIAKEKNIPIFIHFTGSDWCGWCWKLEEEVYSKPAFQDYVAENMVMVTIDFPRDIKQSEEVVAYNRDLATKFNIKGYPTVQLLNPDGTPIAQTGFQYGGPEKYIEHLKELLIKK
ncbi:MAG: thioredoxin family protein [Candidatus Cloacimonetes bacterium]|nr:thioredoxin family protein [Candidatus Cloacimonadota bacterium]MBT5421315.1 thioredoxin family protein [Candidatus Cloacimonadota bacterium]